MGLSVAALSCSARAWLGLVCSPSLPPSLPHALLLFEWIVCSTGESNAVDAGYTLRRFRFLSVRPHPLLLFFFSGGC